MKKKGQATAAGVLVAIIAALIVLYILIIPPEERQNILEGSDSDSSSSSSEGNKILFELDDPTKILPLDTTEFEQEIPNVNIFTSQEGTKLKTLGTLYVKKSLFNEKTAIVDFVVNDITDTKNILLNFLVDESDGRLMINLNGNEVYNNNIDSANINPIELKDYVVNGKNILNFSVSSPGAMFWDTNEYALKDLTITADVTKRGAQESRSTFIITSNEKQNLEKAKLRFVTGCNIQDVGKLTTTLNNDILFEGVPDCGYPTIIDFSPTKFVVGENTIKFRTEAGRYLIDQIKFTSELKEVNLPIYYFKLDEDEYNEVQNKSANVTLNILFVDDENKEADIIINGDYLRLDTDEREYEKVINKYVEEGNNAIKFNPEEAIDIIELSIVLDRED